MGCVRARRLRSCARCSRSWREEPAVDRPSVDCYQSRYMISPAEAPLAAPAVRLSSLSAFFPAHNEEENLVPMAAALLSILPAVADEWELVVVDDGSEDATGRLADELAARHPRVRAVHHRTNRGYGAAVRSGLAAARYDYVFFTDGDHQFDVRQIVRLIPALDRADAVVGYREHRSDPALRRLNAAGWNLLVRVLLGLPVRDVNCAFKLLRRKALRPAPRRRRRSPRRGRGSTRTVPVSPRVSGESRSRAYRPDRGRARAPGRPRRCRRDGARPARRGRRATRARRGRRWRARAGHRATARRRAPPTGRARDGGASGSEANACRRAGGRRTPPPSTRREGGPQGPARPRARFASPRSPPAGATGAS